MTLNRDQLQGRVSELVKTMDVFAPVQERDRISFRAVNKPDDIAWDFGTSVNSIKEFFLPQREMLYRFTADGVSAPKPESERPRVIFLARPCDARGVTIMDKVFLGDRPDETYATLRERTTIVGLACDNPDEHCFCASVGGSPTGTDGMDAALFPTGDGSYVLKVLTDKGRALFPDAASDGEVPKDLADKAKAALKTKVSVPENLRDLFESDYWREVSQSCLKCGACAHLCPTCHCFDIVEEAGCRVRCWDYCQNDTFTRAAAGEDHRSAKFSRCRQRVYHKFDYYPKNFEIVACVGCGRCARHCPVSGGIAEIINGLNDL